MTEPLAHKAFTDGSATLIADCFEAAKSEDGDMLAIACIAFDQVRNEWMIQSNVKAEGYLRFLDDIRAHCAKHFASIAAASEAVDARLSAKPS
jgi:hypothetical protein